MSKTKRKKNGRRKGGQEVKRLSLGAQHRCGNMNFILGAMDTFGSKRTDEVQFIHDNLLDKMKILQCCEIIMVTREGW